MAIRIKILGGFQEVGANSAFININNTGIIIDAGLHPIKRDKEAFPKYELLKDEPVDFLIITHAHTDHIGALPYLLKLFPHIKILAHKATSYLIDIMIKDTIKILNSQIKEEFSEEILSLYNKEILEKINMIIDEMQFFDEKVILGKRGTSDIILKLFPAGHILGAASVYLESDGKTLLHTGDINFQNQPLLPKSQLPNHHLDVIITESTNCGSNESIGFNEENKKKFASIINDISNKNGSILIPAFSLGKTQELLTLVYNLQKSGKIPFLPIYTGGLGSRISQIYDRFCYTTPRINPGFEVSDIPTIYLDEETMNQEKYLKSPAIVIVSNGMMHQKTKSYSLAKKWFASKESGIIFTGYVQENTPGFQLKNSELNKIFQFGEQKAKRNCRIESVRLSMHCTIDDLNNYILDVKPKNLIIVHGSEESNFELANIVHSSLPKTRVIIPYSNNDIIV